jgi:hypothetical protein
MLGDYNYCQVIANSYCIVLQQDREISRAYIARLEITADNIASER